MKTLVATTFLGMPLVAWGGLTVLAVLVIQILIGFRIIKIDFKYHKFVALALLALALVHGTAALIYIFG
jgi:hypothetical protein